MNTEQTYRVKFSTRGRVTIPAALRRKYGLKGGSRVRVTVKVNGGGIPPGFILTPMSAKRR